MGTWEGEVISGPFAGATIWVERRSGLFSVRTVQRIVGDTYSITGTLPMPFDQVSSYFADYGLCVRWGAGAGPLDEPPPGPDLARVRRERRRALRAATKGRATRGRSARATSAPQRVRDQPEVG